MLGAARNSPTTRAVKDISERIARLRKFEAWGALKAVPEEDLRIAVGAERWRPIGTDWKRSRLLCSPHRKRPIAYGLS